jgi:hypothetical protein
VPCRWEPLVQLWVSVDDGPRRLAGIGSKVMVVADAVRYPAWQFDNVAVGAARGGSFLTFSATVDGLEVAPETLVYGGESAAPLEPPPLEQSCR